MGITEIGYHPSEHTHISMGCKDEPTDPNTNHSDRLTAIPLTRYPLTRVDSVDIQRVSNQIGSRSFGTVILLIGDFHHP